MGGPPGPEANEGAPDQLPPRVDNPLFLLDYDGTLAEITADPSLAVPHPDVPGLLAALASSYPVRVITGWQVADLAPLLPVAGVVAIGVHGMEEGRLDGTGGTEQRLGEEELALMADLRARLPDVDGVRVEDKGSAIALHYRNAPAEERVVRRLREWSADLPSGLEVLWGKKILEVRPGGFGKGRAASELAAEHRRRTAVMIGDDTTDEDAFRALPEGVTIKVGEGETAALYRLADVDAVVEYLRSYL